MTRIITAAATGLLALFTLAFVLAFWPLFATATAFLFGGQSPVGYFGGAYDGNNSGNR